MVNPFRNPQSTAAPPPGTSCSVREPYVPSGADLQPILDRVPDRCVIRLEPGGVYTGELTISSTDNVRVEGNGATIDWSYRRGRRAGEIGHCLSVSDCRNLQLCDITFRNAGHGSLTDWGSGVKAVASPGLRLHNCTFLANAWSGLLTAKSDDVLADLCDAHGSRREHGIYLSADSDRPRVTNGFFIGNSKTGIQINAHGAGNWRSKNVRLNRNNFWFNQWGHRAACINLVGVRTGTVEKQFIMLHLGRHGVALSSLDQARKRGCKDVTLKGGVYGFWSGVVADACIDIKKSAGIIVYRDQIFANGVPRVVADDPNSWRWEPP